MEIANESVLKLIRERGDDEQAKQAETELPDQIDTDRYASILQRFGVDPQDLTGGILRRVADAACRGFSRAGPARCTGTG